MRSVWMAVALAALTACVTEEQIDLPAADTSGSGVAEDTAGSGDTSVDDTSVEDTTDTAVDDTSANDTADIPVDDTSVEDTSVEDTSAEDTSVEDTTDTAVDDTTIDDTSANVEECLLGCGVGCPAPEFQICGSDGQRYCNSCYMDCYGVVPATQPSVCDPCGVYDPATAEPYRLWPTPDSCFMSFDSGASFEIATSEAALRALLPCMDPSAEITGIDWAGEVVVRVTQPYNPSLTVQGVFRTPAGVEVATRSPVYCGGAAPPTSAAFVIVAASSAGLHQSSCIDGECTGGPFP